MLDYDNFNSDLNIGKYFVTQANIDSKDKIFPYILLWQKILP